MEPYGPKRSGTSMRPSVCRKAAGLTCPLTGSHSCGVLPLIRKRQSAVTTASVWLETKYTSASSRV